MPQSEGCGIRSTELVSSASHRLMHGLLMVQHILFRCPFQLKPDHLAAPAFLT